MLITSKTVAVMGCLEFWPSLGTAIYGDVLSKEAVEAKIRSV
jgi:hypothetical protein